MSPSIFIYFYIYFFVAHRVQLELPAGVLTDLVDLALYRACSSNHNSSEFLSAMTKSCAEDSILWNPFLSSGSYSLTQCLTQCPWQSERVETEVSLVLSCQWSVIYSTLTRATKFCVVSHSKSGSNLRAETLC